MKKMWLGLEHLLRWWAGKQVGGSKQAEEEGRLCRTQLQLALRAAWRDQGPSRTHTQLKEGRLIYKTLCWKTKALKQANHWNNSNCH